MTPQHDTDTIAIFQAHLAWVVSRATAAVSESTAASEQSQKRTESHDPTTNYGAW